MYCKHCGKQMTDGIKFCTNCGDNLSDTEKKHNQNKNKTSFIPKFFKRFNQGQIIWGIIILVFIGYSIYSNIDQTAIDTNNNGIESMNSGNNQQAITQFQTAVNGATTNDTKINTLKNLGFVYESESRNDEALTTFQEALKLVNQKTFDYYLISAEIALLQKKPDLAYFNYNKALGLQPNDYQINNQLNIFYLNLDGNSVDYENYPKALTFAQKAYNIDSSVISKENLAIANYYNNNYDQSISLFSQIDLTQHPYLYLWLGYSYVAKKDITNSKYYFRKAVSSGIEIPQEVTDYLNSN